MFWNSLVMTTVGVTVSGPYNLIVGSISIDLGSQPALAGNSQAMSTVSGILDGTGSAGSALGQIIIPIVQVIADHLGKNNSVFSRILSAGKPCSISSWGWTFLPFWPLPNAASSIWKPWEDTEWKRRPFWMPNTTIKLHVAKKGYFYHFIREIVISAILRDHFKSDLSIVLNYSFLDSYCNNLSFCIYR